MRNALCLAAFGGLCLSAQAQTLSVEVTFDATSVAIGETFTATMTAYFDGHAAGAYLSSINIDLFASADWAVSDVSAIAWNNPALGFDGQATASGADILGVEAAQFSLIPPVTSGSPLFIMSWTVTATSASLFTYSAQVTGGAPYPFSVTGGGFSDPAVPFGIEVFSSDTIFPAPGALGLLGVGGLAAVRRRR